MTNDKQRDVKQSDIESKFATESGKYRTFEGVSSRHKVKYNNILEAKDYENVIAELKEGKFNSMYAEKRRLWRKSKKFSVWKSEEDFKKLCEDLYLEVSKSILGKVEDLSIFKKQYFLSGKLNTIVKVVHLPEDNTFFTEFVLSDVIYQDEFMVTKSKNGKMNIRVTKRMLAPIPIEFASAQGTMTKWYLKREWKDYIKTIENGFKYS